MEAFLGTWITPKNQNFLFGRPGTHTIADYRLRCNGFRTAAIDASSCLSAAVLANSRVSTSPVTIPKSEIAS